MTEHKGSSKNGKRHNPPPQGYSGRGRGPHHGNGLPPRGGRGIGFGIGLGIGLGIGGGDSYEGEREQPTRGVVNRHPLAPWGYGEEAQSSAGEEGYHSYSGKGGENAGSKDGAPEEGAPDGNKDVENKQVLLNRILDAIGSSRLKQDNIRGDGTRGAEEVVAAFMKEHGINSEEELAKYVESDKGREEIANEKLDGKTKGRFTALKETIEGVAEQAPRGFDPKADAAASAPGGKDKQPADQETASAAPQTLDELRKAMNAGEVPAKASAPTKGYNFS